MKMKKILSLLAAMVPACMGMDAQETADILEMISANNLELRALREEVAAGGENNLAEAALPDPEFGFDYLFGAPGAGNRRDFSVTQSVDFGALSGARRQSALRKNELAAIDLRAREREILTSARKLIYEIIYRNALIGEYTARTGYAREIEKAYKSGLDKGAFSMMDYRKAALNLAEAEGLLDLQIIEREALLAELAGLNGGERIDVSATDYGQIELPESFSEWMDEAMLTSSTLGRMRTSTSLYEQQLRLTRSESLPSLSVGYMAELVPGEEFRGVTVGVSIPLWSSRRKVNGARRQLDAARIAEDNALMQFRINAESLYGKVLSLRETAEKYKALSSPEDCTRELGRALEAGRISLLEYMTEMSFYYSARELALSTGKDYMMALADLLALKM